MNKRLLILALAVAAVMLPNNHGAMAYDLSLSRKMQGRILLQVQNHGEAWYVRTTDSLRYYMKDGATAYQMMRNYSQGITDMDLGKIPSVANTTDMNLSTSVCGTNALANRLRGNILLQVQQHGEAWYVHPEKCRAIYMADGSAAYEIMRYLGFGIANTDLDKIQIGEILDTTRTTAPPTQSTTPVVAPTVIPTQQVPATETQTPATTESTTGYCTDLTSQFNSILNQSMSIGAAIGHLQEEDNLILNAGTDYSPQYAYDLGISHRESFYTKADNTIALVDSLPYVSFASTNVSNMRGDYIAAIRDYRSSYDLEVEAFNQGKWGAQYGGIGIEFMKNRLSQAGTKYDSAYAESKLANQEARAIIDLYTQLKASNHCK